MFTIVQKLFRMKTSLSGDVTSCDSFAQLFLAAIKMMSLKIRYLMLILLSFTICFCVKPLRKASFLTINEISVNFGTEKPFFVELLVGCSGASKPSVGDPISLLGFSLIILSQEAGQNSCLFELAI